MRKRHGERGGWKFLICALSSHIELYCFYSYVEEASGQAGIELDIIYTSKVKVKTNSPSQEILIYICEFCINVSMDKWAKMNKQRKKQHILINKKYT